MSSLIAQIAGHDQAGRFNFGVDAGQFAIDVTGPGGTFGQDIKPANFPIWVEAWREIIKQVDELNAPTPQLDAVAAPLRCTHCQGEALASAAPFRQAEQYHQAEPIRRADQRAPRAQG